MILVLIDFDGVIVDTKKNSFDIFKRCLEKFQNCKKLRTNKIFKRYEICKYINRQYFERDN